MPSRGQRNRINKIVILAGQSNMFGLGNTEKVELDTKTHITWINNIHTPDSLDMSYGWTTLQPQVLRYNQLERQHIGPEASVKLEDANTYSIKFTMGGTSISNEWSIEKSFFKDTYYQKFIRFVKESIEEVPEPKELSALFWLQGESDSLKYHDAKNYSKNITKFVKEVRSDLQSPNLIFIPSEITWSPGKYAHIVNDGIKQATEKLYPSAFVTNESIHANTSPDGDGFHLDTQSLVKIGRRFSKAYQKVINSAKYKKLVNSDIVCVKD